MIKPGRILNPYEILRGVGSVCGSSLTCLYLIYEVKVRSASRRQFDTSPFNSDYFLQVSFIVK